MKSVIHILYKDKESNKDNLLKNKNFYDFTYKHFLITNEMLLNKSLYKGFEQIFYFKSEINLANDLHSILKFLKEMGYLEVCINNCNYPTDSIEVKNIDELIKNFTVISNIINI